MAWFRAEDPLAKQADRLAAAAAEHFSATWSDTLGTVSALTEANRDEWNRSATVAAVLLAVFPLLRACQGDPKRFVNLKGRALEGLAARYPKGAELARAAEGATVPPSGFERTRTLTEVDEATGLALAGWVLQRLGPAGNRNWHDIRRVAPILQRAVQGYWTAAT